jgi:membrane protease subunit HflC
MHQHLHDDDHQHHDHDHDAHHEHGDGHHHHHHDHADHDHHARSRWPLFFVGILAILAIVAVARVPVIVDQTESVYITEFGRPVRLIEEPGLYVKWPYQSRRSFDRRLQLDAPASREMLTRDKKNLEVAWYLSWKIADVDRFLKSVHTLPDASARLEDMAASLLAAELGGHDLTGLIKVGNDSTVAAMMTSVARRIAEQARQEYGITVVDVRLRRLNYPEEVRSAVFEQIRSERKRVAAATRAEGESEARTIRSAADRERSRVVAEAEADAARLIGEGEAEATRIANEAHAADPSFYQFLKTLETYRAALDRKTTLILSSDSAFLKLLTKGVPDPIPSQKPSPTSPVAGRSEGAPQPSATAPSPTNGGP